MKHSFYVAESGIPSGMSALPFPHFAQGIEAMRAQLVARGRGAGLATISTWPGGTGRVEGVACYIDGRTLYFLAQWTGIGSDLHVLRESEHQTR